MTGVKCGTSRRLDCVVLRQVRNIRQGYGVVNDRFFFRDTHMATVHGRATLLVNLLLQSAAV